MRDWAILLIFLIPVLAVIAVLVSVFSSQLGILNPFGRDYLLTGSNVDIRVDSRGSMLVNEEIDYLFKGCYHEVYRNVDLPKAASSVSPYVTSSDARCNPACNAYDRGYEIAGNFGTICDRDAQFFVDFAVSHGIVMASDTAELFYKVWGEDWDRPVNSLSGRIELPGPPEKVYFNPGGIVKDYKIEGNTIVFTTNRFDTYLEARILLPKDAFTGTDYIYNSNLRKSDIISAQEFYSVKYSLLLALTVVAAVLLLGLYFALPAYLFRKYGEEPKIDYHGVYEREPVKGIKPYVINSLCMGKTGDTDKNAITATLLDLIRRRHISAAEVTSTEKTLFGQSRKKDIELEFAEGKDSLSPPEQKVYDYYSSQADEQGKLSWNRFTKSLKSESAARKYLKFTRDFESSVDADYNLKQYFDSKGNSMFKALYALLLVASILLLAFAGNNKTNYPFLAILTFVLPVFIVISFLGFFVPDKVFGRFTKEGYEIYQKSMNYRKFMTDMTLLKKYPPASLVLWEEQLVYATAFGVAEKVISEMKASVKESTVRSSSLYPLYSAHAFSSLNSSYSIASSTVSSSGRGGGFSGGGGAGGGFGGGGGGAR